MNTRWSAVTVLAMACAASGCASITSVSAPRNAGDAKGFVYRMPLRWIRVTLKVEDGDKRTLSAALTETFGDPGEIYVANFSRSWIANDDLTLEVDQNGLLQSQQSFTTESQLGQGLVSLAGLAGRLKAPPTGLLKKDAAGNALLEPLGALLQSDENPCALTGTYVWELDPADPSAATRQDMAQCHVGVDIKYLGAPPQRFAQAPQPASERGHGLFYRQALAYEVTTHDAATHLSQTSIQFAPTRDSPIAFVPVSTTVFAKNQTTLTFKDGMPSKWTVDQDSEWLAVAKLPVDLLAGYIAGVKQGFTDRKAPLEDQKSYLASVSALAAQQAKTAACLKELEKPEPDAAQVTSLCGGAAQ